MMKFDGTRSRPREHGCVIMFLTGMLELEWGRKVSFISRPVSWPINGLLRGMCSSLPFPKKVLESSGLVVHEEFLLHNRMKFKTYPSKGQLN